MITRYLPTPTYHSAVEAAGILHLAGVIADNLTLDMKGQASQIFGKIDKLLADLGASKAAFVTAVVYVTDF